MEDQWHTEAGYQPRSPVGASSLAMDVNDNAEHQTARVDHASFASKLAPTDQEEKISV
ncbi:hypothetical protein SAMN05216205_2110 [Pseudomonas mohnii]|uniref:Catalase n=1 Tax=Pseudomonas mohnii TaxID=395600 RepID=A0ABY0XW07_9PSED|nr:hypothetical protein SAMN05216205_2110 [Pseudomonas mohnii]